MRIALEAKEIFKIISFVLVDFSGHSRCYRQVRRLQKIKSKQNDSQPWVGLGIFNRKKGLFWAVPPKGFLIYMKLIHTVHPKSTIFSKKVAQSHRVWRVNLIQLLNRLFDSRSKSFIYRLNLYLSISLQYPLS